SGRPSADRAAGDLEVRRRHSALSCIEAGPDGALAGFGAKQRALPAARCDGSVLRHTREPSPRSLDTAAYGRCHLVPARSLLRWGARRRVQRAKSGSARGRATTGRASRPPLKEVLPPDVSRSGSFSTTTAGTRFSSSWPSSSRAAVTTSCTPT